MQDVPRGKMCLFYAQRLHELCTQQNGLEGEVRIDAERRSCPCRASHCFLIHDRLGGVRLLDCLLALYVATHRFASLLRIEMLWNRPNAIAMPVVARSPNKDGGWLFPNPEQPLRVSQRPDHVFISPFPAQ